MDRLWAPWRIDYLVLLDNPLTLVMLNRYPYTNGHLMVAPKRHTVDLESLSDAEMLELFRTVTMCRDVLARSSAAEGFNIGINLGKAAGAGIEDHLHLHVVPRWKGDNNFICVVADIRVVPEALLATYDRLLPYFAAAGEVA